MQRISNYFTNSTYAPLGNLGSSPDAVLCPTGFPRTLKILFSGVPYFETFLKLDMIAVLPLWLLELDFTELLLFTLLELAGFGALEELDAIFIELDDKMVGALEDDSGAGQFPPMQNVIVSPGVPMSVILSPVLEPLYQRMAGYLSSENSE